MKPSARVCARERLRVLLGMVMLISVAPSGIARGERGVHSHAAAEDGRTDAARTASQPAPLGEMAPNAGVDAPKSGPPPAAGRNAPLGKEPARQVSRTMVTLPEPSPMSLLGRQWLAPPRLDIVPPCQWAGLAPTLGEIVAIAGADSAGAALRRLEPMLYDGPDAPEGAALLAAMLRVRAAAPDELAAAIDGLRDTGRHAGSAGEQYCVALELAQGELRRGNDPDAAAEAVRAGRLRTRLPDPVGSAETADWLRAEALYRGGRVSEARVIHDRLVRANDARTALAARLRLADVRFDLDGAAFARAEYDTLLPRIASLGVSPAAWSLRFAEAQLAFGDVETTIRQLEVYLSSGPDPSRAALARLRIADALVARGDLEGARTRLQALDEEQSDSVFGQFAALRLASLKSGDDLGRSARIDAIVASTDPALSAWARILRGRMRTGAGDVDTALRELSLLARERVPGALEKQLGDALTEVERLAAERAETSADCIVLARRLGSRSRALIARASDPAPFIALGRCFEQLGLVSSAGEVYAAIGAAFGAEVSALHEARVAVAEGDDRRAAAALEAASKRHGNSEDDQALEEVRAAFELRAGDAASAATRLSQILRARAADGGQIDPILLQRFARAVSRTHDPSEAHARQLVHELDSLPPAHRVEAPERVGEAAFLAARVLLALGDRATAARLFEDAAHLLPAGRVHAQAEVESGELADAETADAARLRGASDSAGGGWARLAKLDRRIAELQAELGIVEEPVGTVPANEKAEETAPADEGSAPAAPAPSSIEGAAQHRDETPAGNTPLVVGSIDADGDVDHRSHAVEELLPLSPAGDATLPDVGTAGASSPSLLAAWLESSADARAWMRSLSGRLASGGEKHVRALPGSEFLP